jgi:hypothetical protein
MRKRYRRSSYRRNPQDITFTDDLFLIATGVLIGVIGYWVWNKNQSSQSETQNQATQTGTDISGNPTSATLAPGNIGIFQNQQPAGLPTTS